MSERCSLNRLQNSLFFLSFFRVVLSLRCRCVTRECVTRESREATHWSHTRRLSPVPLVIFTLVPSPLWFNFSPKDTLKYGLFCSLQFKRQILISYRSLFPLADGWNIFTIVYLPICMDGRVSLSPFEEILKENVICENQNWHKLIFCRHGTENWVQE